MMESLLDHITPVTSRMLWYDYNVALNEGLNYSVATFAPKNFNFSGSMPLSTRVSLAVGVHLVGYTKFWNQFLVSIEIPIYYSLVQYLKTKDKCAATGCTERHNIMKKLDRSKK